jgi:hypothetical protein
VYAQSHFQRKEIYISFENGPVYLCMLKVTSKENKFISVLKTALFICVCLKPLPEKINLLQFRKQPRLLVYAPAV